VAFPSCTLSGTVGPPPISAGRRPTITRGLALSVIHINYEILAHFYNAILMPGGIDLLNSLISIGFI
jgi:hypothetical protein